MLDVRKYLVQTCEWKALTSDSSDEYGVSSYDATGTTLKCFKWNNSGVNYGIKGQAIETKSLTTYILCNDQVKEGDMLDGLVIRSISVYTDLKGHYLYSECGVD